MNPYKWSADTLDTLPQAVRVRRAALGLSISDLAALTGLGTSTISMFERGADARLSTVITLLDWLAGAA